jgi:hypothetical protein
MTEGHSEQDLRTNAFSGIRSLVPTFLLDKKFKKKHIFPLLKVSSSTSLIMMDGFYIHDIHLGS